MNLKRACFIVGLGIAMMCASPVMSQEVLYDQNFESPTGFVNDGGDVNIFRTVNQLYGNQPPGFSFAQANTVETLLITGNQAFGTGYSDPAGIGGNYCLGMLSSFENDLLGLSFDVGNRDYLNFSLTVSSIDLSVFSGPFIPPGGAVPVFQVTLYDNPSGAMGLGSGAVLDQVQFSGTISQPAVFAWTGVVLPLNATNATNGNVIVRIDLLSGGYAAMDNFRIVASDVPGDVGLVPEANSLFFLSIGVGGLAGYVGRRFRAHARISQTSQS